MEINEIQGLIEQSILSGHQLKIGYTNAKGISDEYLIHSVTNTWKDSLNTVAESVQKGKTKPFNKFRYDRISKVDITDETYQPSDHLIEKIRDGSLFSDIDNRLARKGGMKGYRSSTNFISNRPQRLTKEEAASLLDSIDLPEKEGWIRGVVGYIEDGDTYDILLETDHSSTYVCRLFGVDAPECNGDLKETALGWEAKVFVEVMFKESRFCYVKKHHIDSFRRHLIDIRNANQEDVAIGLLEQGLGIPMMGYIASRSRRELYESAARCGLDNKNGLWAIDDLSARYNNIISDSERLEQVDILGFIPDKQSALNKYLKQKPRAKIIHAALHRNRRNQDRKATAKEIFEKMTEGLNPSVYDLDAFRTMCEIYVSDITRRGELANNEEEVKDLIMHIEEMVDELNLGEGTVKGNFSKFKTKLIYHEDPEDRWYKLCIPEINFRSTKDARYCGFRKKTGK